MKRIVTLLTEGFADWETALLNAVAHGFYGAEIRFASPGGKPVTSSGGMKVTPDLAMEDIDTSEIDALVISGGSIWQTEQAPDVTNLVSAARKAGKLIGGICDGTLALARTGLLDGIDHTSNGEGYLAPSGYKGKAHYRNVPHAVRSDNVVTAPATAPVTFMAEVMRGIGLADDNLEYYVGMHAAEHTEAAQIGEKAA
jgi:putative intracellular protease/amidase